MNRAIQHQAPLILIFALTLSSAAYAWDWGGAQSANESMAGSPPSVYLGASTGWTYLANDFDGDHVLNNKQTGETSAVPKFSGALPYGGVLGFRLPLPGNPVDLGIELGYREAHLKSNAGAGTNAFNDHNGVLHEFNISAKGYFKTDQNVQPVLVAGYDIPWLTIDNGVQTTPGSGKDEKLKGGGFHAGAGLCWFFVPKWSLEFLLAYRYRRFTSVNGDSIQESLVSNSIEPSLAVSYHFNFGKAGS
jgi:hypothetical protein